MASRGTSVRQLFRARPSVTTRECRCAARRQFSASHQHRTDGVFRALTGERVQKPWIEAFREQQAGQKQPEPPSTPTNRDLTPKKMSNSYHSVILPLAQEPWLLDTYMNSSGHIRIGTILMDLDALAGVVAYKHTGDAVTTVTAAFDRITIEHPLTEVCDLEYSGQVTYAAGRSSMEITLQVAKAPPKGQKPKPEDVMMTCQCTMVSLDPATKKPVNIAAVRTDTEEERRLFEEGEKNGQRRKELAKHSLLKQTPNDEESDLIHAIWQRQLQYHDPADSMRMPSNVIAMDATQLRTASIMQPQYRNRHHFMIFGGFLLKQTFEIAFCCAASFAHTRPTFVSLDPSTFQNPVPVGSVLYLTATVVYTDPPLISGQSDEQQTTEGRAQNAKTRVQVRVDSKVRDVEHGVAKPTGQFNYTFLVDKDVKVVPRTYTEMMMYVDARRRAMSVREKVQHGDADAGSTERITE
ncbi:hypothetical protein CKM354_000752900 [Cercospora kikuchii]|uniref:HotDog ACOT-type domain-containing protein n=1 Tax=Cercospora kikuchii TaxID=84275 RepID=A0A9P3FEE8_9PEZI|nr:uncharacterized protein CKM354_000752900 [Cercospora kikuchii]GIZ44328.1 hypothetical protein CKM354_000752900 [Cercospora kikuchii]